MRNPLVELDGFLSCLSLIDPSNNCKRIYHGFHHDTPIPLKGLCIDLYNQTLFLQTNQNKPIAEDIKDHLLANIDSSFDLLLKQKDVKDGLFTYTVTYLRGSDKKEPILICEHGLYFKTNLISHLNSGFYIDNSETRLWLEQNSKGKKVLNLYSYTCSLGVAAMVGGAFDVVNVDTSNSSLEWGKENYQLNDIAVNPRSFQKSKVQDFIRFAKKKPIRYDIIIIDPSPPAVHLKIEDKMNLYSNNIIRAKDLLSPNGQIIISCHNFIDFDQDQLFDHIAKTTGCNANKKTIQYPKSFQTEAPKMFILTFD